MPSIPKAATIYDAKCLEPGHSIAIEGHGTDAHWQTANVLTHFTFPWIKRTPPRTEFRALWDEQRLYFRYDVTDTDVVLGDGTNAMEKVIGSDRVEIFFSTGPDLNPYYGIEIDPRGEVLDYKATFHRQLNFEWSCADLNVATSRCQGGYIVEGSVSLATFKQLNCLHQDGAGNYLIAGLYRAEFSHDPHGGPVIEDWMSWVDPEVPSPDFHVPTSFGTIRLVG